MTGQPARCERPRAAGTIHTVGGDVGEVVEGVARRTEADARQRGEHEQFGEGQHAERDPAARAHAGGGDEEIAGTHEA